MENEIINDTLFANLNISDAIKRALDDLNLKEMTPIQKEAIPYIIRGCDVIAQAPTGTGKTYSFALPIAELLDPANPSVQALILCPTRELAVQVTKEIRKIITYIKNLKCLTVYGGENIDKQIKDLKKHPQIIVGTPGRVIDHINRHTLKLENVKMIVLDEADEMLDMGFKEDLDTILKDILHDHQTLLFSATISDEIKQISKSYQHDAIHIKTTYNNNLIPSVSQAYVELLESNKTDCLSRMLDVYNFKQALVFCRTKKKVDDLTMALTSRGYQVECLHGDMKQISRDRVMEMFREGLTSVLIATDVAARGLDIDGIDVVFNYDIPDDVEYYIHRIGRTARAGKTGSAYTFVSKREVSRIKSFEKYLKISIVKVDPPSYKEAQKKKVQHVMNEIIESINSEEVKSYVDEIYISLSKHDFPCEVEEIAGAFLKRLIETDEKYKDAGLDLRTSEDNGGTPRGYTRVFINLGKKDNLDKEELIDLVRKKRHVSKEQVIGLSVLLNHSYFEVPTTKVAYILEELNKRTYNGRKIFAEEANSKSKDKKRPSRKDNDFKEFDFDKKANKKDQKSKANKDKSLKKNINKNKIDKKDKQIKTNKKKLVDDKPIKKNIEIKW